MSDDTQRMFQRLIRFDTAGAQTAMGEKIARVGETLAYRMYLGDGLGNIAATRPGEAYVHLKEVADATARSVSTALNPLGLNRHGLPIIVGRPARSRKLVILSIDMVTAAQFFQGTSGAGAQTTAAHGVTHDLYGGDMVILSNRQVKELAVHPKSPASMQVHVYPGIYQSGARLKYFAGADSADLTTYVPGSAGDALWLLISIATDSGALSYTAGSAFTADTTTQGVYNDLTNLNLQVPDGQRPLSVVYLINGMSSISWKHIHRADLAALEGDADTGWLLGVTGRTELGETTMLG